MPRRAARRWPADFRTKVETLRFQQIHEDLLPKDIPKLRTAKFKLLDLPVEIVQEIASFLPLSSKAAFILSCKTVMAVVGTKSWKELAEGENIYARHDFGRLLERDTPNGVYCYGCIKIHYSSMRPPPTMKQYYSVPQLRQKIKFMSTDRGREGMLYLYTLMYRSGLSCGQVFKLSTWEFWASHSQQVWGLNDHSLLQDSWGWVVMPPGDSSTDSGFRIFPIAADSEAPDTTHTFQIQLGSDRGTSVPISPPSRLIQLGPSMYARQLTSVTETTESPFSECSIIISGPHPTQKIIKRPAGIRVLARRLFRRYLGGQHLDATERHIRSLRNSRKIQDRTLDIRIFRDEMWDRDRHVWAIEQQRQRIIKQTRRHLPPVRASPQLARARNRTA